jgi:YHS domain-containing protein
MKTLLLVGVLVASASMAFAEPTNAVAVKAQTTCPVMGGAVNHKVFADYQGQRIYFCCNGCPAAFKKDPEKYMKKFKNEGVALEKVK